MRTKTSFISQVLECPLITLMSRRLIAGAAASLFSHTWTSASSYRHVMCNMPAHHVVSRTHTHTHTSSQLIAFPFFLQRDLWLGECWRQTITMSRLNSSVRQSGRGGSGDIRWPVLRRSLLLLASHCSLLQWLLRSPTHPRVSSVLENPGVLTAAC